MRRGRGKGKRLNASTREDHGSGEEEKIPAFKRRGRPQKPMKDDFEEEDEEEEEMVEKIEEEEEMVEKIEEEEDEMEDKDLNKERKRKVSNGSNIDINEVDNGLVGLKSSSTDDSMKPISVGFRQSRSRRKNKPRRAAEAIVECNGV